MILFIINKFLFFRPKEVKSCCFFMSKTTILKTRVQYYVQYCTLLEQSDCRYLVYYQ